ncbi:uncharacterized protein LOC133789051 [Humulus lupulus]|uniref:uncharacterized protein LOC133789051 n=1 Tax=Humulus lupulus TaxID=3486 RepID=UPI002B40181E|nr:uncharacterized protein LOC133789051 [Humulus lupulus]
MERIEQFKVLTNEINMNVASIGTGPPILFLHGFPELWFSWRHQMLSLSKKGYRCIAPDLRGYGDTDAPPEPESYSALHIAGDIVGLLDNLGIDQVFLVGHDWGAFMAWSFCLFRPDRVKAVVNLSVPYIAMNPKKQFLDGFREYYGDLYYMCRFQEQGEMEKEFASIETETVLKKLYTSFGLTPLLIPEEKDGGFKSLPPPETLPSWLTDDVLDFYTKKFDQSGFARGLNYYRSMNTSWKLLIPWSDAQVKVPAKFIVGDLDHPFNLPGMKDYVLNGGFKKDVPLLEEVVIIQDVPHFINQARPDEISDHIYEFIKKF